MAGTAEEARAGGSQGGQKEQVYGADLEDTLVWTQEERPWCMITLWLTSLPTAGPTEQGLSPA